ncbi:MAG: SpoIID/LytB domain-containing protein, partial [Planctomycetota bacterium]
RSSSPPVQPPPRSRPAIDWLSRDPSGALVLPDRVSVRLPAQAEGQSPRVVELALEDYVEGVVAAELAIWSAEPAELEAQAIAARTYAASTLAKRRKGAQSSALEAGVMDQAYRGAYDGSGSAAAQKVAERLRTAIARTRGMVLVRRNRLEETRYHASCGGHTARFFDVFQQEAMDYGAVGPGAHPCAPCARRAKEEQARGGPAETRPLSWITVLDQKALTRLGKELGLRAPVRVIRPISKDAAGRWLGVHVGIAPSSTSLLRSLRDARPYIGSYSGEPRPPISAESRQDFAVVSFDRIRAIVGYDVLKSAMIDAAVWSSPAGSADGPALHLQGRGRGHGVGLCQEGARDMARAGRTAEEILTHYYAGSTIERLREVPVP